MPTCVSRNGTASGGRHRLIFNIVNLSLSANFERSKARRPFRFRHLVARTTEISIPNPTRHSTYSSLKTRHREKRRRAHL